MSTASRLRAPPNAPLRGARCALPAGSRGLRFTSRETGEGRTLPQTPSPQEIAALYCVLLPNPVSTEPGEGQREVADPSPRSNSAAPANASGPDRATDSRLRPPRHDLPVRSARHRHGQGYRPLLPPPSIERVLGVLAAHRRESARRLRGPLGHRQLRHAQNPGRPSMARPPSTLPRPFHTDQRVLAQHGRTLVRQPDEHTDPARGSPIDCSARAGHRTVPSGLGLADDQARPPHGQRFTEIATGHGVGSEENILLDPSAAGVPVHVHAAEC